MINLEQLLSDHWNIKDKKLIKFGPVWQIKTKGRDFCLKRCKHGLEHLIFANRIIQFLQEKGFHQIIGLIPTNRQIPYVETAEGPFVLMEWVGRPLRKKSEDEWVLAAKQLAGFHRAASNVLLPAGIKKYYFAGKWLQRLPKRIGEITESVNEFFRPENKFEEEVKKDASIILESATIANMILQESQYSRMVQEIYERPSLCHGNVKAKNFTVSEDGTVFIIDFDSFRFDLPVQDLSNLFFEALSSLKWSFSSAQRIFEAYNQERPVHPEEVPILEALLFFPNDLHKILQKYNKRTDHQDTLLKKWHKEFPKFIEQREFYGRLFPWLEREVSFLL